MTVADAIIYGSTQDAILMLEQPDENINDIDEYGFTPLIESVIVDKIELAEYLIKKKVEINKPDATGRTALHWAVDNYQLPFCQLLLENGADANAYTYGGQSVLVYPYLRRQLKLKKMLYHYGAVLTFAQDFINTKLIGHRFHLEGDVDIVSHNDEFIELDYEGFFLEFTLDIVRDSLMRYKNHFAARKLRPYFSELKEIIKAFTVASKLLKFQHNIFEIDKHKRQIDHLLQQNLLLLPIAYEGHAISFIRYGPLWAKCDRGENSLREGTTNIYIMENVQACNSEFLKRLLYEKSSKSFVHEKVNQILALKPIMQLPLSAQTIGNCSWANIEGAIPTMQFVLDLQQATQTVQTQLEHLQQEAIHFYEAWSEWDKERALGNCIHSFYKANEIRRASKAAILAGILFQIYRYDNDNDIKHIEKILPIVMQAKYRYILTSYLKAYGDRKLTKRGYNLLQLLEDHGINPADLLP